MKLTRAARADICRLLMILPQTAEYALRAMAQLANLPLDKAVRGADLSKLTGVPEPYLAKIMRRLAAAGLLHSEKGHGGGFKLAAPPSKIRFSDVLLALDVELDEKRCAFGWEQCSSKKPCLLHPAFTHLKQATLDWANKTTLADLKLE
jgi:Rrf2 family protein